MEKKDMPLHCVDFQQWFQLLVAISSQQIPEQWSGSSDLTQVD